VADGRETAEGVWFEEYLVTLLCEHGGVGPFPKEMGLYNLIW